MADSLTNNASSTSAEGGQIKFFPPKIELAQPPGQRGLETARDPSSAPPLLLLQILSFIHS